MSPRLPRWLVTLAVLATAAICVRLGFWQVSRLHQKERLRAAFEARLAAPALLWEPGASSAPLPGTRVAVQGEYDLRHQVLLSARGHDGDVGVGVITPLVQADGSAVLVDRGWLPAMDAITAHPEAFPEPGSQRVEGLALALPESVPLTRWAAIASDSAQLWSSNLLARDSLAARLPYSLAPFVVQQLPGASVPGSPRRESPERPDPAVHFWYAVQWFAIAGIVLAGGFAVSRRRPAPFTERQ